MKSSRNRVAVVRVRNPPPPKLVKRKGPSVKSVVRRAYAPGESKSMGNITTGNTGPVPAKQEAKMYAMSLLHPWLYPNVRAPRGLENGVRPTSTLTFITRQTFTLVQDGSTGLYYMFLQVRPFPNDHFYYATATTGGLPSNGATLDATGYSAIPTLVDQLTPVSMGVRIRPISNVTDQNGTIGVILNQNGQPSAFASTTFSTWVSCQSAQVYSGVLPGERVQKQWLPLNEEDSYFYNYDKTVALSDGITVITVFAQATSAVTYEVESCLNIEYSSIPTVENVTMPVVQLADPSSATLAVDAALRRHAYNANGRTLLPDDSAEDSFTESDAKALGLLAWKGTKRLARGLGNFFLNVGARYLSTEEKVKRLRDSHLWDDDVARQLFASHNESKSDEDDTPPVLVSRRQSQISHK